MVAGHLPGAISASALIAAVTRMFGADDRTAGHGLHPRSGYRCDVPTAASPNAALRLGTQSATAPTPTEVIGVGNSGLQP